MNITIDTEKARTLLKTNHKQHQEEYTAQIEAWKVEMAKYNQAMETWVKSGGKGKTPHQPEKPQNYSSSYEDFLQKLRWHTRSTIDLDDDDYRMVVLNEFNWKHRFQNISAFYGVGSGGVRTHEIND